LKYLVKILLSTTPTTEVNIPLVNIVKEQVEVEVLSSLYNNRQVFETQVIA